MLIPECNYFFSEKPLCSHPIVSNYIFNLPNFVVFWGYFRPIAKMCILCGGVIAFHCFSFHLPVLSCSHAQCFFWGEKLKPSPFPAPCVSFGRCIWRSRRSSWPTSAPSQRTPRVPRPYAPEVEPPAPMSWSNQVSTPTIPRTPTRSCTLVALSLSSLVKVLLIVIGYLALMKWVCSLSCTCDGA